jgi:hypothetical protein
MEIILILKIRLSLVLMAMAETTCWDLVYKLQIYLVWKIEDEADEVLMTTFVYGSTFGLLYGFNE